MDFQFVRERPSQFARQVYKYYDEDENIIKDYLCKNHLLILSTKKLYMFYSEAYIDYCYAYLKDIEFTFDEDSVTIVIKEKTFEVLFGDEKNKNEFQLYIEKYKK